MCLHKRGNTDFIVGPLKRPAWLCWMSESLGMLWAGLKAKTVGLVDASDLCLVEGICQLWLRCLEEKVYALDESQKVSGDGFLPANWQGPGWEDNPSGVYWWHSSIQWVQSQFQTQVTPRFLALALSKQAIFLAKWKLKSQRRRNVPAY